jgi:GDPmannose 4,6-dehydratase
MPSLRRLTTVKPPSLRERYDFKLEIVVPKMSNRTGQNMKKALITGITGQDGSYLAEFLLSKGYEVHGIIRKTSGINLGRIQHLYLDIHDSHAKLFLHYGELTDSSCLTSLIYEINPSEIYHLGAQSHVRVSFDMPTATGDITGLSTMRMLEAIKRNGSRIKFYQASSSEMFGATPPPQNEKSPFYPRSPYAVAKVYSYWATVNFREAYNLFACNGILFNHESPRRGDAFVTRKITKMLANILKGKYKKIYLGNLNAKRDWGFAPEYIEVMHRILQQENPDDYVIGTGESHSVREFIEEAFNYAGIEIEWWGEGVNEKGIVKSVESEIDCILKTGDTVIEIDPWYFRPTEVESLRADPAKTRRLLNWETKISFRDLVKIMVDYDMQYINIKPRGEGLRILAEKGFDWTSNELKDNDI